MSLAAVAHLPQGSVVWTLGMLGSEMYSLKMLKQLAEESHVETLENHVSEDIDQNILFLNRNGVLPPLSIGKLHWQRGSVENERTLLFKSYTILEEWQASASEPISSKHPEKNPATLSNPTQVAAGSFFPHLKIPFIEKLQAATESSSALSYFFHYCPASGSFLEPAGVTQAPSPGRAPSRRGLGPVTWPYDFQGLRSESPDR